MIRRRPPPRFLALFLAFLAALVLVLVLVHHARGDSSRAWIASPSS